MSAASQRKMKPSGVDWIGDVPEGWGIDKFCYRFDFAKGLNITKQDLTETGVPVVSYGQIHSKRNDGVHLTDELLRHIPAELTKGEYAARLKRNDFVFADTSEDVEGIGNCVTVNRDEAIYAGYHTLIARPIEKVDCGYFGYMFKSECWRQQLRRKANSVKVYSISQRLFKGVSILLPPLDEQKRIAAKLDRLCGRVDELAENLKGEIAALQEYRKSLITECVTKGLNPKAKMKPSGVVWIGDIPEKWTVMRLKYGVTKIGSGKTPLGGATVYSDDGVLFIRSQNVYDNGLVTEDIEYISPEIDDGMANSRVQDGDVLLNITGGSIGRCCVYSLDKRANVNQHVCIIRVAPSEFLNTYVKYFFNGFNKIIVNDNQQGGNRESLNFEQIGNLKICVPPFDEQSRIAAFLDKRCAVIDAKIAERQQQLEKLGEYRLSVIYEYVTGKKGVAA